MKVDGQVIELDPKKQYIIVFDPRKIGPDVVRQFANRAIKSGNIYMMHLDSFKIIENSDRIVGFTVIKNEEEE